MILARVLAAATLTALTTGGDCTWDPGIWFWWLPIGGEWDCE
jgi:hypothetical protein